MNYLLSGYYLYDSFKQACFSCLPDLSLTIWGGKADNKSVSEKYSRTVARIEEVRTALCKEENLPIKKAEIQFIQSKDLYCTGSPSRSVICIGVPIVRALRKGPGVDFFKVLYDKKMAELPDPPEAILATLAEREEDELHTLAGLHDRCVWKLSDEELRFVMAHEIKGHAAHSDHSAKTGISLIAGVATLAALHILFPSYTFLEWGAAIVSGKIAGIVSSRFLERRADKAALNEDAEAQKGAQRYFKRCFAAEAAQEELHKRNPRLLNRIQSLYGRMESVSHPSMRERYESVLAASKGSSLLSKEVRA